MIITQTFLAVKTLVKEKYMYCTYCGSKVCAEGTRLCIMSPQARNLIVSFLESNFVESSVFNKSYVFVPTDLWDEWASKHNIPSQEELLFMYPDEDLHSLLFLILDEVELSPELRSFFNEPVDFDESEMFSEFSNRVVFDTSRLRNLTREDVLRYTGRKVKNLPKTVYVNDISFVGKDVL